MHNNSIDHFADHKTKKQNESPIPQSIHVNNESTDRFIMSGHEHHSYPNATYAPMTVAPMSKPSFDLRKKTCKTNLFKRIIIRIKSIFI